MSEQVSDSPGVIAFPPLLYGGTLVVGLIIHFLAPTRPFPALPARLLGGVLLVVSGALVKWAKDTMRRAGTNVRPDQPATTIVVDGPFRFTRNPLYLGTTGLYIGVALLIDALWPLVLLVPRATMVAAAAFAG